MSQSELLIRVIKVLNSVGIPYMITGSFVSSFQGQPRSTHDIDIVIAIQKLLVKKLVAAFPAPDYYLDEQSIFDAIEHNFMFNLTEIKTGDKIDFWILTDHPFDQSRFSRKYSEDILGIKLDISTPEDTILKKLHWAKESGGSEKQFQDALAVYEIQYGKLDLKYLDRWAKKLEIDSLWQRLQEGAKPI